MRRLASSLVLLLAFTAACTRDSVIYGQCETIFDCRTGEACGADGYCVEGAPLPGGAFGVELLPATNSGTGPVRTELPEVALAGGDVALDFAAPVTLSGRVLAAVDTLQNQRSIGAAVTISRKSRMGLPEVTYSVEAAAEKAAGEGAFSLRLPPTTAASEADCLEANADCYELRVVPSDLNSLPPLVKPLPLPADAHVEIPLMGNFDVVQVHGTVKDATLNPQGGLEVRAVDGDGRTVSSVVTTRTDGDNAGSFVLTMLKSSVVGEIWLQVAESEQSPNVPRFLFVIDTSGGGDVQLGDVVLLDFQAPVTVTYRVKGTATNGQSEGVGGAQVRFTSYLSAVFPLATPSGCTSDKCAVYTRQAATNAAGEVTLTLIPPGTGGYEVDILPGPNSPYSALHLGSVEVEQPGVGADFTLARKLEIRGEVVDAHGLSVVGATVTATPREVALADADATGASPAAARTADLALGELPSTMQTDDAGQFLVMVEPGVRYDLVVTPPRSSPNPVTTVTGQQFAASGTLNIQLPEAALLAGSVAAWDGSDTEGALVRVYEVVTDPDTTAKTAWLRGEALVASDGGFKLIMAAGSASLH
jgi:hypothetical protein